MSAFLDSLPDDYRFSEEDVDRAWDIFAKYFNGFDAVMTPEEEDFIAVMDSVERAKKDLGFFPSKQYFYGGK